VTVSIFEILATLPSGLIGSPLDGDDLARYLREEVGTDLEKQRNARHILRDELYRDGGVEHMKGVIDQVFTDPDVRRLRKDWIRYARFSNPLRRVVNELSTVYSEPARRSVAASDDAYQSVLDAVRVDEVMFQIGRMLNLHRSLLVGFRVKQRAGGELVPSIDVATPGHVRAVLHPNDASEVVGWLVEASYRPARHQLDVPAWTLWSDHERAHLRADFSPIPGSHVEHGLGVCPWVPVTLGPPGAGFWPGEEGEDLVAAHISIWLSGVFLLKESKSATKQSVIQGDTTSAARGQAADSEVPIEIGDGTAISTVDMSMDLDMFRKTSDHILEHVAQNYGMSASLINHEGVQSAEARELMRVPLRELRLQQQVPLRRFEERLAKVMAAVLRADMPAMAFSPDGWRIEFGEAQTPLSGNEAMDVFLKERTAGTTNTIAFIQRRRPGMTAPEAEAEMLSNIAVETKRVQAMRELMSLSGALGSSAPDAQADEDEDESQDSTAPEIFGRSSDATDNSGKTTAPPA